ncbi:MAG: hypothetical protein Q7R73_05000 [bacterium]|nr:hypothetical protein [bacterium]
MKSRVFTTWLFENNHLRFSFDEHRLAVRVTGENHEKGVPEALDKIAALEQYLKEHGVKFEAFKRKWFIGKEKTHRTDAITLELEINLQQALENFAKAFGKTAASKETSDQGG